MIDTENAVAGPLVSELVCTNTAAEFRNDVQLGDFRSPRNLKLAEDFIFTARAAVGRKSSVELLRYLSEGYLSSSAPNRFVFIATYGHGKSHFGVAAANYFGKPDDSPEVGALLSRIEHAASEATAGYFRDFKRNHRPFLILILRGDEPSDLHTKFFRAVDLALRADGIVQDGLPFWYKAAGAFVDNIPTSFQDDANTWLAERQLDLGVLRERIARQDAAVHEIARQLHLRLYGSLPDFGSSLSLKEAVEWIGDNLVGAAKPYGGALILFDEFSAFVRDYALQIQPGSPLQDLLNGVESTPGKIVFAAFAQRDPEAIARGLLGQGDSLQSLITQLNRLPKPQQYQLHSSLEEVLDAYLKQNDDLWAGLVRDHRRFANAVIDASERAFGTFNDRYAKELRWTSDHFRTVVTKGCYPLHPVTTALLCSIELEATTNPRSVLGFVSQSVESLRDSAVWNGGRPAWILPGALVDYFRDMLGEARWRDYKDAIATAGGPDTPAEELAVLRAMLLQITGALPTRGRYHEVIAQISVLSPTRAQEILEKLAGSSVIRYDAGGQIYTLWPAGNGANKVEKLLSEKCQSTGLDATIMDAATALLHDQGTLAPISVSVDWGHKDDWRAEQVLLCRSMFNEQSLVALASAKLAWRLDNIDRSRGVVAWLVAETPEDASWLRENAAKVLATAFKDVAVPVLVMKPSAADPELARLIRRVYGLQSFSNADRTDVGQQQYEDVWNFTVSALKTALGRMQRDAECETPIAFRARLQAIRSRESDAVLKEMYRMAYGQGPTEWFDQYKVAAANLRKATMLVMAQLVRNSVDTPGVLAGDNIARQIVDKYLYPKWGLLTQERRLRQPSAAACLAPGWRLLDEHFALGRGTARAEDVVTRLLNPPYGFDYNTVSLLVAGWLGFNRHDLEVSVAGRLTTPAQLLNDLKPKDFVYALKTVGIKRSDVDQTRTTVRGVIDRVDRGCFTQDEAADALKLLAQYLDREDDDLKPAVRDAEDKLQKALEKAQAYDKAAAKVDAAIQSKSLFQLPPNIFQQIASIYSAGRVRTQMPAPSELQQRFSDRTKSFTEQLCKQLSKVQRLEEWKVNEERLSQLRAKLTQFQMLELIGVVETALKDLRASGEALQKSEADRPVKAALVATPRTGPLTQLREGVTRIEALAPASTETVILKDRTLNDLRGEIDRLVAYVGNISTRVAEATSLADVEAIREDVLRKESLFKGSEYEASVEQAVRKCTELRLMFAEVQRLRKTPASPVEAEANVTALAQLKTRHAELASSLQLGVVDKAAAGIRDYIKARKAEALEWLLQCEKDASSGGDPVRLKARLSAVPAFLPEDQAGQVDALLSAINSRINDDVVANIVQQFLRIDSKAKREECVARLQSLLTNEKAE